MIMPVMPSGYRNITYLHLTVRDGCCGKTNKEVNSREIMQIDKLIPIHLKYLILVLISAQNSDGIPFLLLLSFHSSFLFAHQESLNSNNNHSISTYSVQQRPLPYYR